MNVTLCLSLVVLTPGLCLTSIADQKHFTYTYEPETLPAGAREVEQWVSWRGLRNDAVGQNNYSRWEFRTALEYGVTDNYQVELYVNSKQQSYQDSSGEEHSDFRWSGISLENRYQVLNPAEHPVGLTLYLEPTIWADGAELEQKIILGQRHGQWKWAANLVHATEWEHDYRETEGEVAVTFGLTRQLGKHWSVGLELRDHNEIPEYSEWENTALFVGPALSFHRGPWWAVLTFMPQVYGANFQGNPDDNRHLDLKGHERFNTRLIVGRSF